MNPTNNSHHIRGFWTVASISKAFYPCQHEHINDSNRLRTVQTLMRRYAQSDSDDACANVEGSVRPALASGDLAFTSFRLNRHTG